MATSNEQYTVVFICNEGNSPYWNVGDIATLYKADNPDIEETTYAIVKYQKTENAPISTYYVDKAHIEFLGCDTPDWASAKQVQQPTVKFSDASIVYGKNKLKDTYKQAHDLGKALKDTVLDLLPLVRSGKTVHLLARDCEVLGDIFADYHNVKVSYGLSRAATGDTENTKFLCELNGIKAGDIVVDTGFAGSIPRKISQVLRDITGDYDTDNIIRTVLLSGDSSCFGKAITTDGRTRDKILTFEHSPKWTVNEGTDNSTVCVLDKSVRYNARVWRYGFIAGVMGISLPKKLYRADIYREQMYERINSYRQTKESLRRLEQRIKYSGQWYVKSTYIGDNQYSYEAVPYNGENPYWLGKMYSKRAYAVRAATAANQAAHTKVQMEKISDSRLFPYGISPTIEKIDTTVSYDLGLLRTDSYMTVITGSYHCRRMTEYFNSHKLYEYQSVTNKGLLYAYDCPVYKQGEFPSFNFNRLFVSRDGGETFNPVIMSDTLDKFFYA